MISILIISFCSALNAQCIETRWQIDEPVRCQTGMAGMQIAQQWLAEHPGYKVRNWHCEDGMTL